MAAIYFKDDDRVPGGVDIDFDLAGEPDSPAVESALAIGELLIDTSISRAGFFVRWIATGIEGNGALTKLTEMNEFAAFLKRRIQDAKEKAGLQ